MSAEETRQLLRGAPYFPVTDLAASAEHYEKVFGFRREYIGGTPPEFAILSRDGLPIMLKLVSASSPLSPNEQQGGTWDAFFWGPRRESAARGAQEQRRRHRLRPAGAASLQHGGVRGPRSRRLRPGFRTGARLVARGLVMAQGSGLKAQARASSS